MIPLLYASAYQLVKFDFYSSLPTLNPFFCFYFPFFQFSFLPNFNPTRF